MNTKKDTVNIYKNARESTQYTQEQAAELIPCHTRTLQNYESGHDRVPDEVVVRMCHIYNTPWLGVMHMNNNVLARKLYPRYEDKTLEQASIAVKLSVKRLNEKTDDLLLIAANGQVNDDEVDQYDVIIQACDETVKAIQELKFCKKK